MGYVDVRIHFESSNYGEEGEPEILDDMSYELLGRSEDMEGVDMYAFTEMFLQSDEQHEVAWKLIEAIR